THSGDAKRRHSIGQRAGRGRLAFDQDGGLNDSVLNAPNSLLDRGGRLSDKRAPDDGAQRRYGPAARGKEEVHSRPSSGASLVYVSSGRPPYAIPSFFCISSSEYPFVSGYVVSTTTNCTIIIAAKNRNGTPPDDAASTGNTQEIAAFMIQCVKLPRLCPFA